MKNLIEQLDRMKDLMVYQKGKTLNEISTKSVSLPNIPKEETPTGTKTNTEVSGEKQIDSDNCLLIQASGEFVVDVDKNSGAVDNFIKNLEEVIKNDEGFNEAKVKGGSMYITEIKLQGFASNYYKGAIEPDWDNDWCKKWVKKGNLYQGVCTDWEIKKYSGKKLTKYKGSKTTNDDLAKRRAENLGKALEDRLRKKAEEAGIKMSPDLKSTYVGGGTMYTHNVTDEYNFKNHKSEWRVDGTGRNPGQIVLCTAKICYEIPKEEECSDKCMVKNSEGKCICPEEKGLKEVDGKCICIETNEPPDENCQCKKPEPEKCPDPCMKRNEEGNCECPSDMKYDKEKKECVCKDENKIKVPGGCKCEKKKIKEGFKCNYQSPKVDGSMATKATNYVGASLVNTLSVGNKDVIYVDFESFVVPDAFYVKYGEQEFFSGFMGKVWDSKYNSLKGQLPNEVYENFTEIVPKFVSKQNEKLRKGLTDNLPRNFIGELVYLKQNNGLLESINSAISSVGGSKQVTSIFGDSDTGGNLQSGAEKISKQIKSIDVGGKISAATVGEFRDKYIKGLNSYGDIMKKMNTSFTIENPNESLSLTVLVFSPLGRTIFNMKINCEADSTPKETE
jgi:hypothetical protein